MFLRLCGPPSIPLSFTVAGAGYLILFDTHAFVLQCQWRLGKLPSQSGFCVISMHFTATPRIPPASTVLKSASFNGISPVERESFTADLTDHLRTL